MSLCPTPMRGGAVTSLRQADEQAAPLSLHPISELGARYCGAPDPTPNQKNGPGGRLGTIASLAVA
ncbi:hypothetical protein QO014_003260 [Kaistia dalseonensis]|uniref:Uncharacterized protein n=1 Tax=Kaistia dalseonensis TaxID=410840 RepID=A0ABU0HAR7_9HYPH|nr:hypothetical protein [Kaistia dalseonensis]